MANEKTVASTTDKAASDLNLAKEKIKNLGLGHNAGDKREDPTGFHGAVKDKDKAAGADSVKDLAAALAGKTGDDAPEADETTEAKAPDAVEAKAPAKAETGSEDMDRVRRFLTLKQVPVSAQEAMSDEELSAMRVGLLEQDNQRAKLLEETNTLRSAKERQSDETAKAVEPQKMVPATTEDLEAQLKTLVDDGELSESAAKTLSAAISASTKAVLDQVEERLGPVEAQTESSKVAGEAEVQRLKATVRAEVGERFPGLDDPESLAGVEETFSLLATQQRFADLYAKDGREATIRALYEAAAGAHGIAEVNTAEDADRKRKRREDRANGTPSTNQRKSPVVDNAEVSQEARALQVINKHRKKASARW